MFAHLRQSRSLLMGLAIAGVALYHAPFAIDNIWLKLIHENLCWGVDLFLFFSGLGACHSIQARGGKGYLLQRVRRILPGLYLFLIPWSLLMVAIGAMNGKEFFGSITLLGWWFGLYTQLNWYFSAVWLYFLLAVPLYALFRRTKHPVLLWLLLVAASFGLQALSQYTQLNMLVARLPVFLTGMLFGRLEQTGFSHENRLRAILFPVMLLGLWSVLIVYCGLGWRYGYTLGLWWYPYALIIPGGAVLVADLHALLRRFSCTKFLFRPLEVLGQSSSEVLILHAGIYKIIQSTRPISNHWWLLVFLVSLCLGVLYRRLVVEQLPVHA